MLDGVGDVGSKTVMKRPDFSVEEEKLGPKDDLAREPFVLIGSSPTGNLLVYINDEVN